MSKYYKVEDIDNAIREAHAEAESNEIGEAMFNLHCVVSDLPTIEVSEDCISREWILEEFEKGRKTISKSEYFDELVWLVIHAPSVVPKEKIGTRKEEEKQSVYGKKIRLTCLECGDVVDVSESAYPYERYCRYCGAKMKG